MKISIIMCVKNSMPYIMASIKSFQMQDYKNKELIIVYSKSNDQTEFYLDSLEDKNINIYNYNGSIYSSLNYGISKANGEIIGILHSDDVFFEMNTLKNISKFFLKKKVNIVYGNILYSEKNNLLKLKRVWDNITIKKKYDLPPHTSVFIKKNVIKKIKYKTKYLIAGDTEFLLNLSQNYKLNYFNRYIVIMRSGGLSTSLKYFFQKFFEDISIFKKYKLSILEYLIKVISKISQIFVKRIIIFNKYHRHLNETSKVNFINLKKLFNNEGKIVSALNLAYLTFNYKHKLRSHKYMFWADGIFSSILTKKEKIAGRVFLRKVLSSINKNNIKKQIYILGNLENKSKEWLKKKIKKKFNHKNLPFGDVEKIINRLKKLKLSDCSIIFLTLPTPKQEIIANEIIKKYPNSTIICIGGSINILSGVERESPKIFNILYLEWLWRLKFDTKRRIIRLTESVILLIKIIIFRKIDIF